MSTSSSPQQRLLQAALACGALRFGQFTLKSGRQSPYFFNAGQFSSGAGLSELAAAFADTLVGSGIRDVMLFGPAYKGIPLVAALAQSLWLRHGIDLPFAYNRKEIKDHGEGGQLVGAALAGQVWIVDDVVSAGTSVRESLQIIRQAGALPAGVLVALDRQERGHLGGVTREDLLAGRLQLGRREGGGHDRGCAGCDVLGLGGGCSRVHLSHSPITKSIEPRMATMSATKTPGRSSLSTCRLTKDGARILRRHGAAPPSLRM